MNLRSIATLAVATTVAVTTSCCGPATDPVADDGPSATSRAGPVEPAATESGETASGETASSRVPTRAIEAAMKAANAEAPTSRPGAAPVVPAGRGFAGIVKETMDAAIYTYVRVETENKTIWAAAPTFDVEVGDSVLVPVGMPMVDFRSDTLDRTFDEIYFCGQIQRSKRQDSAESDTAESPVAATSRPAGSEVTDTIDPSSISKPEGGLTVADVFAQRSARAGKEVIVRGKVVKFHSAIMGRNWIHIRDGSGVEGSNDLTVTSDATVEVGDIVVIRGVLATEKDFGAGYRFDVIVESAKVTPE